VASTRRAAAVLDALRRRGVPEAALARIRAPAGGAYAASQEEIALAALAEVVVLRRSRGAPPRQAAEPAAEPDGLFATDPVCGMAVEVAAARHRLDHADETLYFCSEGCLQRYG